MVLNSFGPPSPSSSSPPPDPRILVKKRVFQVGFRSKPSDPFNFFGSPQSFAVNMIRLGNIDEIYLGDETITFFSHGVEVASLFYHDLKYFNSGGIRRI